MSKFPSAIDGPRATGAALDIRPVTPAIGAESLVSGCQAICRPR
jgi:hypothetical protein